MKAFAFLFTLILALGAAVCLCMVSSARLKRQVSELAAMRSAEAL